MPSQNHEKVTLELSQGKTLIFTPKDLAESVSIQQRLFNMGYRWKESNGQFALNIFTQLAARDGRIWKDPSFADVNDSFLCTADQLEDKGPTTAWAPDAKLIFPEDHIYQKMLEEFANSADEATRKLGVRIKTIDQEALKEAEKGIDEMVGLVSTKKHIHNTAAHVRANKVREKKGLFKGETPSHHLVFTGPPGVGKTSVARELTKIYYELGIIREPKFVETSRDNFVGTVIGETEKKTNELIESALGGILFIDEAYLLNVAGAANDFGHVAIGKLVKALEDHRDDLIVIVAGYSKEMKEMIDSNPGLASRFKTYIPFPAYSPEELGEIMDRMLKKEGYTMTPEAQDYAMGLLKKDQEEKGERFANARIVRNLIDLAKDPQDARLQKEGLLNNDQAGLSDKDHAKAIMEFTLADIQKVSLKGIEEEKAVAKIPFGFDKKHMEKKKIPAIA